MPRSRSFVGKSKLFDNFWSRADWDRVRFNADPNRRCRTLVKFDGGMKMVYMHSLWSITPQKRVSLILLLLLLFFPFVLGPIRSEYLRSRADLDRVRSGADPDRWSGWIGTNYGTYKRSTNSLVEKWARIERTQEGRLIFLTLFN